MPRKKKAARELTTDEIARKVFPKKAIKRLKEIAHERDGKGKQTDSRQ